MWYITNTGAIDLYRLPRIEKGVTYFEKANRTYYVEVVTSVDDKEVEIESLPFLKVTGPDDFVSTERFNQAADTAFMHFTGWLLERAAENDKHLISWRDFLQSFEGLHQLKDFAELCLADPKASVFFAYNQEEGEDWWAQEVEDD